MNDMSEPTQPNGRTLSFKVENDKVVLFCSVDEKECYVDIPSDVLKQIIENAPPSQEKKIRELLELIYEIQKKRLTRVDDLEGKLLDRVKDYEEAINGLKKSNNDKLEILKWQAVIQAIGGLKTLMTERRHLSRLSYQEEGELSLRLRQLQSG